MQNHSLPSPVKPELHVQSKPVIVYCRSGRRSAECAKQLKEKGFVKIYDLEGGIAKWEFEGFEVKENWN